MRVPVHQCCGHVRVVIKEGVFFSGKSQHLFKIRVHFWPEICTLGVFFNFDNERIVSCKFQKK